jgi:hypothetical protein
MWHHSLTTLEMSFTIVIFLYYRPLVEAYHIYLVTKNGECKQTQQKLDEARGYIGIFLYSGVKHCSLIITECYNAKIKFLI